jgi:hypothetical protein
MVFDDWGYAYNYLRVTDRTSLEKWTSIIVDKWAGAEGSVWYREFRREMEARTSRIIFCLDKVSGSGAVLESVCEFGEFPVEADMDPRNPRCRVLYRR